MELSLMATPVPIPTRKVVLILINFGMDRAVFVLSVISLMVIAVSGALLIPNGMVSAVNIPRIM
jgi:hypothetical protein